MSNNKEEKQYGLIIPKKQPLATPKPTNIFADDNDSDEEDGTDWVKKALKAEGEKNKMKKQTKLNMQKALQEDPTIYQYDEVYDNMERTKTQLKEEKKAEKKTPRYIQSLLKAAERRKREQEHRIERMVQKEREAEGSMYADKESFVTSAYRAKLEEFKKLEEEESRMDRLEAIADVKKQQDMSGFYRHLYEQTVKGPEESEPSNNMSESNAAVDNEVENVDKKEATIALDKEQNISKKTRKVRQYRQRVTEEDSDTDTEIQQKLEENETLVSLSETQKNDDKDVAEPDSKKPKQIENPKPDVIINEVTTENTSDIKNNESENNVKCEDNDTNDNKIEDPKVTAKAKIEAEKKERSKIWEKRTVGAVFEAALQRYYARKAIRLSGS
ncbi:nuclear speckle splicing regulatory protein 1 [Calliopsis andreniformis]|uniref:nuclear speckle splicing regulatory protein 1 n=1 Tax=Calliopsis andreniformis TaxID=337506 RepID=UPI003FCE1B24